MHLASPKQLHSVERPREKLLAKGVQALTTSELLQIIIGSGTSRANVAELATGVSALLQQSATLDSRTLLQVSGISTAKACAVIAALELGKRISTHDQFIISGPEDVVSLLSPYANKKQEHLIVFSLDGAGRMLAQRLITIGTLTNTLVHPREVFADAITDRAAAVILAHNHPSGDTSPSSEDKHVTKVLQQAGEILGVNVQDHIIISGSKWSSLRQLGLL